MNLKVQHFKIGLNIFFLSKYKDVTVYCKFEEEKKPLTWSIAIFDAAVIVVRGCLLQLIVCRGFYFVGFYPIANEVANGYTCPARPPLNLPLAIIGVQC
jgi:hypothetical protein